VFAPFLLSGQRAGRNIPAGRPTETASRRRSTSRA